MNFKTVFLGIAIVLGVPLGGFAHDSTAEVVNIKSTISSNFLGSLPGQYSTIMELEDGSIEVNIVMTIQKKGTFTNIWTFKISTPDGTLVYECNMSGNWSYDKDEGVIDLDDESTTWRAKEAYSGTMRVSAEELKELEGTSYFKDDVYNLENNLMINFMELRIISIKSGYMSTAFGNGTDIIKWRKIK